VTATGLIELGDLDGAGQARYRIVRAETGDLVLWHPSRRLTKGLRELDAAERIRLAELSVERPALVVETSEDDGHYVVLIDEPVNLDRHVPLGPGDAELLDHVHAVATFGRRDDDVLALTPWNEDDGVTYLDPDAEEFSGIPLVSLNDDRTLQWHRGNVPPAMDLLIRVQLQSAGAAPDTRYAVLTNPFGECVCIAVGSPVLPHEDVRRQALVGTSGLLDGAVSLDDAAQRLRSFADRLQEAGAMGWSLSHPIAEDTLLAELGGTTSPES
jgi:hypothetical protein